MYIYNITIKVSAAIAEAWLCWMRDEHMPALISTGCFYEYRLLRLLDMDDTDGPTYAAQYSYHKPEDYQRYLQSHAAAMRDAGLKKWGDGAHSFRTNMEVVAED